MKLRNLIAADMRRALLSWRFLFSACGVALMMFSAVPGLLKNASSIWYLMDLSLGGSGMASMILCILPVFAFGISFAKEWEEKAVNFWIIRTGVVRYTISKIIVSFISGFLTIAMGMAIFIFVLRPWFPLFLDLSADYSYEALMEQGHVFFGILLYVMHFGLSGALTAVCAMWLSTYLPNRFVATVSPVVLDFTVPRITGRMELPPYLNPVFWVEAIYSVPSPAATFLIKLVTILILCCLICIATILQMKRRIGHA